MIVARKIEVFNWSHIWFHRWKAVNSFPSKSVYRQSINKYKKVDSGRVTCDSMIESKHVSETDRVQPEIFRQTSLNAPCRDRSGKQLLLKCAEFNILKLNAFVKQALKSQNICYLRIVVFYYNV